MQAHVIRQHAESKRVPHAQYVCLADLQMMQQADAEEAHGC